MTSFGNFGPNLVCNLRTGIFLDMWFDQGSPLNSGQQSKLPPQILTKTELNIAFLVDLTKANTELLLIEKTMTLFIMAVYFSKYLSFYKVI